MVRYHAVVADDDEDTLTLLARVARSAGLEVLEASSAGALLMAVERLQRSSGLDIVISDIAMPGLDGIELTRRLRAMMPALPVILVTGYAHRGILQAAADAGARTVLAKPVDAFVLRALIGAHTRSAG
jgi:CheY-like chemotaxis protein